MCKIHFVSFFGIDLDWDLFDRWREHYDKFGFDDYMVLLHTESDLDAQKKKFYRDYVQSCAGWSAGFCGVGEKYWDADKIGTIMKAGAIEAYVNKFPEDDFIVVADSDEFQDMPAQYYRDVILANHVVQGELVDCYGDALESANNSLPLDELYPHRGQLEVMNYRRAIPMNRTKIMAHSRRVRVLYQGQHAYLPVDFPLKVSAGHDVLHYTYRENLPWRMASRAYYTPDTIQAVVSHFGGGTYHPAMDVCRQLHEKRRSRGPAILPGAMV